MPTVAGDPERVDGAFTTSESVVDATVDTEVDDPAPVRRSDAASLGRLAVDEVVPLAAAGLPLLIFIRAASWFNDGMRPAGEAL